MKRKHVYFTILALILFLNVVFAKYIVHQFYYQNYGNTLIFVGINIILFPLAILIYRLDRKNKEANKHEQ